MGILLVGALLGLITGAIGQSKGYSFFLWWLYGALLFIVALPMVILLKPAKNESNKKKNANNVPPGIVAISLLAVMVSIYFKANDTEGALSSKLPLPIVSTMESIEDKVAYDAEDQYRIAKRNGSAMEACSAAGLVSAAWMQAKNELKYIQAKKVEDRDCFIAGLRSRPPEDDLVQSSPVSTPQPKTVVVDKKALGKDGFESWAVESIHARKFRYPNANEIWVALAPEASPSSGNMDASRALEQYHAYLDAAHAKVVMFYNNKKIGQAED